MIMKSFIMFSLIETLSIFWIIPVEIKAETVNSQHMTGLYSVFS